jgi:S1-C subfamily serine protease
VIISPDGYIITNNHVVENAIKIGVTLSNNSEYIADVVGTDPNTDLTLLKIDATDLNFVEFGNSDETRIGEWVLAVGNPFNLTSTVTAGIVSAKARSINILSGRVPYGIESFIQTDAAINPGNSGGALVNLKGELIGINTAIASPTGSFAGYSFAVPATLVSKVVNDLKEFGEVQRAVLGVGILDVNDPLVGEKLSVNNGVYVSGVNPGSAAEEAGLLKGDIVIKIDETDISNVAELQELVARNRPGDEIKVTYLRNDKEFSVTAQLKNIMNSMEVVKAKTTVVIDGAEFQDVLPQELEELNIDGGAKIVNIEQGSWKDVGVKRGFIVTAIDKVSIENAADLIRLLKTKRGGILIEGVYEDGTKAYYGMGWQ